MSNFIKKHKLIIYILILLVPIGLATKFYTGINYFWVNNSLSDILYEIFWSLLLFILFPKIKILTNVLIIFIITSGIEVLQLVDHHLLATARSTFLGKILLGTTFVWADFFYYFLGCLISYFILFYHKKQLDKAKS